MDFAEYRDAVVEFLGSEDRVAYGTADAWDQVRLSALALIDRAAAP